ncbi:hypothetical protein [Pararhodospirillum oryzae]|uniref:Uncharacterized protein n=1 Tax=Pararhodospirillum oryzae TaxID=478448 RepID=A0A512HBJ7_9PROT|nr:hypothetical protein [Pararhodospirillum oryzae]GEO82770.1 hypothetical protein ROR02_29010 [Pararhodospirillum oryzae]
MSHDPDEFGTPGPSPSREGVGPAGRFSATEIGSSRTAPRLGNALTPPVLDCRTATQFTRHITSELEEQTRLALERYVGDIGADEVVDMARNLAQMRGRYLAQALAVGTNRQPPAREEIEELKGMREQIDELDLAFRAIRDAIAAEQVAVREIAAPQPLSARDPVLRHRPL